MNYSDIIAAAQSYADRQDVEVTNNLDLFISMVESRINRLLKTREQSVRATVPTVTGQEYYALPPDFGGMRDIQINSDATSESTSTPVDYLTPALFNERRNGEYSGRVYYTIVANQFQIFPKLDTGQQIELVYYQRVPNLNSTDTTNWLSDSHPDAYIAGMTSEIEMFAKHYDAGNLWRDRMASIIGEIEINDVEERWSGPPLQIRLG